MTTMMLKYTTKKTSLRAVKLDSRNFHSKDKKDKSEDKEEMLEEKGDKVVDTEDKGDISEGKEDGQKEKKSKLKGKAFTFKGKRDKSEDKEDILEDNEAKMEEHSDAKNTTENESQEKGDKLKDEKKGNSLKVKGIKLNIKRNKSRRQGRRNVNK